MNMSSLKIYPNYRTSSEDDVPLTLLLLQTQISKGIDGPLMVEDIVNFIIFTQRFETSLVDLLN